MGLFGALTSGVSGITAQSSALGATSDNIANVNTIGFRATDVQFTTLVTTSTSDTIFSPGGVQSAPITDAGVQGLLEASTSATDFAISGDGFFVVNESSTPGVSDTFLFTRAGSFFTDADGFLRNTGGFFLQGFPTDASGNVVPANPEILTPNTNVISTDFLTSINLAEVGGTAAATSNISLGANLPATAEPGDVETISAQLFDTLGIPNTVSFDFTRTGRDNEFSLSVVPPQGTQVLTVEDELGQTVSSIGQLEFVERPADGAQVIVDGIVFEFDTNIFDTVSANFESADAANLGPFGFDPSTQTITAANGVFSGLAAGDTIQISGSTDGDGDAGDGNNDGTFTVVDVGSNGESIQLAAGSFAETVAVDNTALITTVPLGNAFTIEDVIPTAGTTASQITAAGGTFTGLSVGDQVAITNAEDPNNNIVDGDGNPQLFNVLSVSSDGSTLTLDDGAGSAVLDPTPADDEDGTLTVTLFNGGQGEATAAELASVPGSFPPGLPVVRVDVSQNTTLAQDVATLLETIQTTDTDFAVSTGRVSISPVSATSIIFTEDGTDDVVIDPSGLLAPDGSSATLQTESGTFTVNNVATPFRESAQFTFDRVPNDGDEITINGITYTFSDAAIPDGGGSDTIVSTGDSSGLLIDDPERVAIFLADLEAAIEGNDPLFAVGASTVSTRVANNNVDGDGNLQTNTLVLEALDSGAFTVEFSDVPPFAEAVGGVPSGVPIEPNGTASFSAVPGNSFTVDVTNEVVFDSTGVPAELNFAEIEIIGFDNGAANFDDDPANTSQIALDFGSVGTADGLTQFGSEFSPNFITSDGAAFGEFAGVTVDTDGLVTALFDNGETVPVFQIPLATFTNTTELTSFSGNVFGATSGSGDPVLFTADSGPAGQIIQSSLEASTVDIGTEFANLIIIQQAFSAATNIITAADDLLTELVNVI